MKYGTLRLNSEVLDYLDGPDYGDNDKASCTCTECVTQGEFPNGKREHCTASRYQDSFA